MNEKQKQLWDAFTSIQVRFTDAANAIKTKIQHAAGPIQNDIERLKEDGVINNDTIDDAIDDTVQDCNALIDEIKRFNKSTEQLVAEIEQLQASTVDYLKSHKV